MENQKSEQCLYLDNLSNVGELEKQIIEFFAKEESAILEHFDNAYTISRQADKNGYYVDIKINPIFSKTKARINGFSKSLNLFLNGQLIGGAMIFVENGLLAMIECYCFEDNDIFIKLLPD